MTINIFDTTIQSKDYILRIIHEDKSMTKCDFMSYDNAYSWGKSLVVLSRGLTSVIIEKNGKRLCLMTGMNTPWYGDDIVSVWTRYKGGTKIKMKEKRQTYVNALNKKWYN